MDVGVGGSGELGVEREEIIWLEITLVSSRNC